MMQLRDRELYWEDREWCSWETGNDVFGETVGRQGMM